MSNYVFFYGGIFSNFHRCTFNLGGIQFYNSETAFMVFKAMHFGDTETAHKMLKKSQFPAESKRLGRLVKGFSDAEWAKVRYDYMLQACRAKYSQNPDLKQALLDTEDKILVEAALKDVVWGIGRGLDYPFLEDESKWLGQNLLGKVLMQVREELRNGIQVP